MQASDDRFPYGARLREAAMVKGYEDLEGNFDYRTISRDIKARARRNVDASELEGIFMGRTVPTLDVADAICKGMGIDVLILFRD
jgi:hypothetical protein